MAYAFKCANCGRLEAAAVAGEREVPAACTVCGHGVRFDPVTGIKTYEPDNWIVLSELSGKELKPHLDYHAITKDEIETHTPAAAADPGHEPQNIEVFAEDGVGSSEAAG